MKKSKIITAIVAVAIGAFGLNFIPAATHAVSVCDQSGVSEEVKKANGCPGAGDTMDLSGTITSVLEGVIGVLGIVAVIFIVVGGVNYMTSAGDASKVEKAKKTILYAVIGLVIAVLAFAIVNFVVGNILK